MALTAGKQSSRMSFSSAITESVISTPKTEEPKEPEAKKENNTPSGKNNKKENSKPAKEKKEEIKKAVEPTSQEVKKAVGRPKSEPYIKKSFNIPKDLASLMNIKASLKGESLNTYVVSLIEEDLKDLQDKTELIEKLKKL